MLAVLATPLSHASAEYPSSGSDPISAAQPRGNSEGADPNPTTFVSASVERSAYAVGDNVVIRYEFSDADGIASVEPLYSTVAPAHLGPGAPLAAHAWSGGPEPYDRTLEARSRVGFGEPGRVWVVAFSVRDGAGHVTMFRDQAYAAAAGLEGPTADLSAVAYSVVPVGELAEYAAEGGGGAVYARGSGRAPVFGFGGPAGEFCSLEVDGEIAPPSSYDVAPGSVTVALAPAFLDRLPAGGHVATAFFRDGGRSAASFDVEEAGGGPAAGGGDEGASSEPGRDSPTSHARACGTTVSKRYGDAPFFLGVRPSPGKTTSYAVVSGGGVVEVGADGKVTIKRAGRAVIRVSVADSSSDGLSFVAVDVAKAGNPMTVKAKRIKARHGRKATVKARRAFVVKRARGGISYKKKSGSKQIRVTKAGTVKVGRGLKRGVHKVKVAVRAKGNVNYAPRTRTVALAVVVR